MIRNCTECYEAKEKYEFSSSQWRKGDGSSRCSACISATQQPVDCNMCGREFGSDNELQMHRPACGRRCAVCYEYKRKYAFSNNQWRKDEESSRCVDCLSSSAQQQQEEKEDGGRRCCNNCYEYKERAEFSSNQWRKGDGSSRCSACISIIQQEEDDEGQETQHEEEEEEARRSAGYCPVCNDFKEEYEFMYDGSGRCIDCVVVQQQRQEEEDQEERRQEEAGGRRCITCGEYKEKHEFGRNQWHKGDGSSRCPDCITATQQPVDCDVCGREFGSDNELQMHMKTHLSKDVACPLCGVCRFASSSNAVAHVESGSCPECLGADNARRGIYDWTRQNAASLMVPRIEDEWGADGGGGGGGGYDDEDEPYMCKECGRSFKCLSSMMSHEADKHGTERQPLAIGGSSGATGDSTGGSGGYDGYDGGGGYASSEEQQQEYRERRCCTTCYEYKEEYEFSSYQWCMGDGSSRCADCVLASSDSD